jgi:hypothetical protein
MYYIIIKKKDFVCLRTVERLRRKPERTRITEVCGKGYGGSDAGILCTEERERNLRRVRTRFVRVRLVKVLDEFLGVS